MNDSSSEPNWLEDKVWEFRVWQWIFICCGILLSIVILLCCCFRFRIPRTKQEIEADYQRKKIAKKFRDRLAHIKNSEMDDMDLQKALARIQAEFLEETQKCGDPHFIKDSMQIITNRSNAHQRSNNV